MYPTKNFLKELFTKLREKFIRKQIIIPLGFSLALFVGLYFFGNYLLGVIGIIDITMLVILAFGIIVLAGYTVLK